MMIKERSSEADNSITALSEKNIPDDVMDILLRRRWWCIRL